MGSRFSSTKAQSVPNDCQDNVKSTKTCTTPISVPLHLFAAGTAAAVSAIAVQPLEVLKIRLQTNIVTKGNIFVNLRHMFRAGGMNGLYRGLMPTLGAVVPSISIYFTLYNSIKSQLGCPSGDTMRDVTAQSAAAGLASSATAAITNPLWLIKTRLQTQPLHKSSQVVKRTTFGTFQVILKEEGFRGFYRGLGASFLTSSQAMVQFPIYESLKSVMCSNEHNLKTSTACYFAASAISASLACILTYPAEVVRARLQAQHGVTRYTGISHAFRKIWAQEGAAGLYRGLFTSLLKMTPAHAISFTAYEFILRSLTSYYEWDIPDLATVDLAKNENIQFTFRPFVFTQPRNFEPHCVSRHAPKTNPYSFCPSFSHIVSSKFSSELIEHYSCSERSAVREEAKKWSEYFW